MLSKFYFSLTFNGPSGNSYWSLHILFSCIFFFFKNSLKIPFCFFFQVSSTIFPTHTKLLSTQRAHSQLLQRVCYFSYQSSCLKKSATTEVAMQKLCSLKAALKSPCWMAFVHPILPSPQLPQKPVLALVKNSIATCTLPRVSRTWIGTGTCRKGRVCELAWRACCRFRPCSRRERFLSLWRRFRRYEIPNTTWLVTVSQLNPQKAVEIACVFHPTERAQRVLGSIHINALLQQPYGASIFWVTAVMSRDVMDASFFKRYRDFK